MSSITPSEAALVEAVDLEAVAAALCTRFGDPTAEAYRLSTLHEVLRFSRSLAAALDAFARGGSSHYRGIHCTADMHPEVDQLKRCLTEWTESVSLAGAAYRDWNRDGELTALRPPAVRDLPHPVSTAELVHATGTPASARAAS